MYRRIEINCDRMINLSSCFAFFLEMEKFFVSKIRGEENSKFDQILMVLFAVICNVFYFI